MKTNWAQRKGADFEREVQRRLAEVFGSTLVRRNVKARGGHAPADVVTPGFWIECKARRCANPRAALRQAEGGARVEGRWAVAVCKDDGRPAYVALSFDDFVALLRDWHELRLQRR